MNEKEKNEKPSPRNIPLPIQREVRKRCGFGCIFCGLPLFEYDHLTGWANVRQHVADEITLLCDQHHREKTSGLITEEAVRGANSEPYNMKCGISRPYDLHYEGDECEIVIGSNSFGIKNVLQDQTLIPVSIDDVPMVAFVLQDGHLLLNLYLFDEYNQLVLHIRNNQLFQSVSPWDIQFIGRNFIVREGERKILVDMTFEVPNRIRINRGRFLRNGVELLVRPDQVILANNGWQIVDNSVMNCQVGFLIGPHSKQIPAITTIPMVPRYSHDRMLSRAWIQEYFEAGGSDNNSDIPKRVPNK